MQVITMVYIILLGAIFFCTACTPSEDMNIKGQFAYTDGSSTIDTIDFSSSAIDISSLYKSTELGAIDHLTRIGSKAVIFGECPITGDCVLRQHAVDTSQTQVLRTGRLPSYISNHNKLFFYDKALDGSSWLFEAILGNKNNAIKVAKEPKKKMLPNGIKQSISTPAIQISNDDIIFIGIDEQLWLYNIVDKKLTSTEIKDCRPILWREKSNQLLCSDWETWSPFLLDLNTKSKVEISELKGAYGFVYNVDDDTLVYGRTRSKFMVAEAYDIFLYTFESKKEMRIKKDVHIAAGVWVRYY